MGDFKINEKTVFTQSGSAEPAMGSTITGIPAAGVTGVLPVGVTGGSGLDKNGWFLLQTVSGTSTSHTIGSASNFNTTYDDYMITGTAVNLSIAQALAFLMTTGGVERGVNYSLISYGYGSDGTLNKTSNSDYSYAFISGGNHLVANDAAECNFQLYFSNPTNTTFRHNVGGHVTYESSAGYSNRHSFSAFNSNTGALTAFKFKPASSGNITAILKLYGLQK